MSIALRVCVLGLCLSQVIGESCVAGCDHDAVDDATSLLATGTQFIDQKADRQEQLKDSQNPLGPLASLAAPYLKAQNLTKNLTPAQTKMVYSDLRKALKTAEKSMVKDLRSLIKKHAAQLKATLRIHKALATGKKMKFSREQKRVLEALKAARANEVKRLQLKRKEMQLRIKRQVLVNQKKRMQNKQIQDSLAAENTIKTLNKKSSVFTNKIQADQKIFKNELIKADSRALAAVLKAQARKKKITNDMQTIMGSLKKHQKQLGDQVSKLTYKQAANIVNTQGKVNSLDTKEKQLSSALKKLKVQLKEVVKKQAHLLKRVQRAASARATKDSGGNPITRSLNKGEKKR